ncbi:transporter substrate-binding domain-containing protein [Polaromonas sp. P1-6]|nr:transporter substrate-binding domain-containing protein [Polaromonas sp. P1-6]
MLALLGAGLALMNVAAKADALADVKKKGQLTCGVVSTAKPFAFVDAGQSREVVGYDVDICNAVARSLGVKAVLHPVSADARIPELAQGRVDVLTAVLSWTPERAQQIDFSRQYFEARLVVMVRKNAGISRLADLKGKRVSVVKGSTSEIALKNEHPDAGVLSLPDPASAFLAFKQGKSEGFSISELLMARFMNDAGSDAPTLMVLPEPLQTDKWGVGVKKGERALLDAVNDALAKMEASGEGKAIFERWFSEKTGYPLQRTFKFEPITK